MRQRTLPAYIDPENRAVVLTGDYGDPVVRLTPIQVLEQVNMLLIAFEALQTGRPHARTCAGNEWHMNDDNPGKPLCRDCEEEG